MSTVRITQIDGELPNLALMRLSAWHREIGDRVEIRRSLTRELDEPAYDRVYGSAIFSKSRPLADMLRSQFDPEVTVIGGTGVDPEIGPKVDTASFVPSQFTAVDYGLAPNFKASLGFTSRGCRFKCAFCVVPGKEGRPYSDGTVGTIWRGPGHPKKLHLLDNDFFGNPLWRERVAEIREGGFRVCINQGVNIRVISDEAAAALASIEYRDQKFTRRRLYTAWDSLGDERVFFRGVDRLEAHGIPARNLMAYMLVGFDPEEDWDRLWHRFRRMVERGVKPYVMTYQPARGLIPEPQLLAFERWVNTGLYRRVEWIDYRASFKTARQPDARQIEAAL